MSCFSLHYFGSDAEAQLGERYDAGVARTFVVRVRACNEMRTSVANARLTATYVNNQTGSLARKKVRDENW